MDGRDHGLGMYITSCISSCSAWATLANILLFTHTAEYGRVV